MSDRWSQLWLLPTILIAGLAVACERPDPVASSDAPLPRVTVRGPSIADTERRPKPLFVFRVNGVRVPNVTLDQLARDQIESITMLKGEAARAASAPDSADLVALFTLKYVQDTLEDVQDGH